MSTSTPKLGLVKPDPTDFVDVLAQIDGSFDKIDAAIGITICTSSTRPASPFTGQRIKESDSGYGYIWSGSAYLLDSRGYQQADVATSETTTSGTYIDLTTAGPTISNIPMIAGITYKITISAFMKVSNIAAVAKMSVTVSGADTVAASVFDGNNDIAVTRNGDDHTCTRVVSYTPATTGNHTIKAQYSSSAGATATFGQRRLIVE